MIELIVVIILIGLTLTLTIPRFQYAIVTDDLKATTRRMVGMIKGIREEAIREQKIYFLHFDLETNRFWFDSPAMTEEEREILQGVNRALFDRFAAAVRENRPEMNDKDAALIADGRIRHVCDID